MTMETQPAAVRQPAQPRRSTTTTSRRVPPIRQDARPGNRPGTRPGGTRPGSNNTTVHRTPRREPESVLQVERWLDRHHLPARLPMRTDPSSGVLKSVTVLLFDELQLGDGSWAYAARTAPRNLILVVDRLRLVGDARFDLSGRALDARSKVGTDNLDRSGGDLVILARDVVCEPNGRLTLRSAGGRGMEKVSIRDRRGGRVVTRTTSDSPRHGGGHGGDLVIAARRFHVGDRRVPADDPALAEVFVLDAPGGGAGPGLRPGDSGSLRLDTEIERTVVDLEARDLRPHGYAVGVPAVSRWVRRSTSEWLVAILDQAITELRLAALGGDRREALGTLSRAVALARDGAPLHPDDRALHGDLLVDLTELSDRFSDTLIDHAITVQLPSGLPRRLDLFTEGRQLATRVAPTDALIRPRRAGDRQILGLLALDPERPDRLHLEVEVELTLDPWLAARASDALAARGETLDGRFDGWDVTARPIVGEGIVSSRIEPSSTGIVRIALELETERASLVFARLASAAGLPLVFDWRSTTDRDLTGTWEGPPLTLLRRFGRPIEVGSDGRLHNRSDQEVTIGYLALADETFRALTPALSLPAGGSAAVPDDLDPTRVRVPAEAITYTGTDASRPNEAFHVARGDQLVELVTVTNLLAHDEERGGLLYVEIDVTYERDGESTAAGPYRLASAGADGDTVDVAFLVTRGGPREVTVTGTAHYDGGSRERLEPIVSPDLAVKLTADRLPAS